MSTTVKKQKKAAEDAVEKLQAELTQLAADFENFRKMALAGHGEAMRQGIAIAVRAIAPAMDAFSRALAEYGGPDDAFRKGLEKIRDKFMQAFTAIGVTPVPIEGSYDPKYHEAVERVAGEEYVIVGVVGGGWMWKESGEVIVPAKVKVGMGGS